MKNLWVAVSGAVAQQRNVETIANNVANANTPGFKKDVLAFKEHLTVLEKGHDEIDLPHKEWKPADFYRSYGAENAHVKVDGSYTIFEQGQLVPTNNPLDMALNGKGFFEVETPNGVRFTRTGNFTINNNGELVTHNGNHVLKESETGQDIAPSERYIKFDSGKISINIQGDIFQGNNIISKLSIVEFKDIHALKKEGNSMYINNDLKNIKTQNIKTAVHQSFIEQSNVNTVEEMANLIKANRQFETIQKVIKAYDNMAGKAVNEIAKF